MGSLVPRLLQAGRSSSQLCGCCVIGWVSAGKGGARRADWTRFFLGRGPRRVVSDAAPVARKSVRMGVRCVGRMDVAVGVAVRGGERSLAACVVGALRLAHHICNRHWHKYCTSLIMPVMWLPDSSALSDWHIRSVTGIGTIIVPVSLLIMPVMWLPDSSALPDWCNETLLWKNGTRTGLAVLVLFLTVVHVTAGAQARGRGRDQNAAATTTTALLQVHVKHVVVPRPGEEGVTNKISE